MCLWQMDLVHQYTFFKSSSIIEKAVFYSDLNEESRIDVEYMIMIA